MQENQSINKRFLTIVTFALIFIAVIKIFVVTFSSPIMGYANSYDFLRQSSCVGLWQSYQNKPKIASNPEAPVNAIVFDRDKNSALCMKSSDNFFPYMATLFHSIGERVDFREVSFWKAIFITVSAVALIFYIRNPASRVAVSMAFLLVFGDIANLLYLNTLYLEFTVISGCFLSLSALVLIISTPNYPGKYIIAFSIFSLSWFGLSKQQYMPLASLFSLALSAIIFLRWRAKSATYILLTISLLLPVIYGQLNKDDSGQMKGINIANKTDTFLGAVLPEANDKESALSNLGLPVSCLSGIGKNWYYPGLPENHPCPELEELSRIRLLKLFVLNPSTFFRPMYKATVEARPFYPTNLGHLENPAESTSGKYIFLKETSLSTWFAKLPPKVYSLVVLISMISGPIFILMLVLRNKVIKNDNEFNRSVIAMIGLGGVTTLYAIAASVFGDGYIDVQKHAVAFMIGIAFQVSGAAFALICFGLGHTRICGQGNLFPR